MKPTESVVQEDEVRTLEVEIERILPGGVGLAHAEGLTLFVSLAAPGDMVRIVIDRVQGKVGFASIVEIIKASPVRIEPPCPYFGLCGGCDFQQLTYEAQLQAKAEIIRDCLRRLGGINDLPEISVMPAPKPWHYRARAMWQFDSITNRLGYFARGSNDVCDVEYCAVLVPELQNTLEQVRKMIASNSAAQLPKHIEAAAGDEEVSLAAGPTDLAGFSAATVTRVIGNETYHFSADGFFQVNHELLDALITEALRDAKGETAIDLFCGVGLFTLPLARRFKRVVGVEANRRATEFARRNLERGSSPTVREGFEQDSKTPGSSPGQPSRGATVGEVFESKLEHANLGSVGIITSRVGDWLKESSHSFGAVDFLLLDPPRTGAENRDIAGILAMRPRRISYVSCDPATLARDLKKLIAGGYSLDSIAAFDMFPQTHHVETVVHLSVTTFASA